MNFGTIKIPRVRPEIRTRSRPEPRSRSEQRVITSSGINKKEEYRNLCLNYIEYIRKMELCDIQLNQLFEAVLIEFRIFPHLEFIIRNTIHKLGNKWSHTIICGNINYEFINNLCKEINTNIKIIKLDHDNLSVNEYSNFLCTIEFWELLKGDKILIYQEDSCIFKKNIEDFIYWDYIGAPFIKKSGNNNNDVGNGGFSLRTRKIMIDVIKTIELQDTILNSRIMNHMKISRLEYCPEDVYFSKNMLDFKIGLVADWDSAFDFSTELVCNPNSLGGHCFWLKDNNWKQRVINVIEIDENIYLKAKCNSNLIFLTNHNHYKTLCSVPNVIDVDLEFMREAYPHLNNIMNNELINYVKEQNFNNHIFHFKQLSNIFQNIDYLKNIKNNILINYKNNLHNLSYFVNLINSYTYEDFKKLTIQLKTNLNFQSNDLLILVFIGNEKKGFELLNKLKMYSRIEIFSIVFCINYKLIDIFKEKITEYNFNSFIIYSCNEFGNDITPTLLAYDEISKMINFTYIIKLHTKSDNNIFNNYVDFLLTKPLKELLNFKNDNSNSIGFSYININNDWYYNKSRYNVKLLDKYEKIFSKSLFVPSTIFLTFKNNFTSVLDFFIQNYKTIFLQNTYDNNCVNIHESYVHFMERLFGVL